MKSFIFPLFGLCSLLGLSPSGFAQKSWIGLNGDGGDGAWVGTNFSTSGLPGSSDQVHFYRSDTYTAAESDVLVDRGVAFTTGIVRVGRGKTVNLTLGSGTSWTTTGIVVGDKNIATQTGSGASDVTITAEAGAGVLKLTQLVVGLDDVNPGVTGNRVTLSGEHLKVEVHAATTATIVGRSNGQSELLIVDGGDVAFSALAIGQSQNDNRTEVTGTGSKLTLSGITPNPGATNALTIGFVSSSAGVNGGNSLYVAEGGEVAITGINNDHTTYIGSASALGGNVIEVDNGGTFRTTGRVIINDYNTSGGDRGANGVLIREGGRFVMESTEAKLMSVSGFVTLEAGGELSGNGGLAIAAGGVFRAAGDGLDLQGDTEIQSGAAWEVGTSNTAAETLTLKGNFSMQTESELRFTLLADGSYDQIHLETGTSLALSGEVLIDLDLAEGYAPIAGTAFTLFTGDTAGISGNFDFSQYDPALWDFSGFNQAGGWQVVAIPEPSSVLFIAGVGTLLLAVSRRKQNKC